MKTAGNRQSPSSLWVPRMAAVIFPLALASSAAAQTHETARLFGSDAAAGDELGRSLAVCGDTAVVGAWLDDNDRGIDAGAAYVFVRSDNGWTLQQKLTALDGADEDHFGVSVAVCGDTIVVGANSDDNGGGDDAGSAYIFVRSNSVWTQQKKLIGSDTEAGDNFGYSVAIDGDTVVVGAFLDDLGEGLHDAGSVYVFFRRSNEAWTEQKLVAPDAAANDRFGTEHSVAIYGDTVVVGAYLHEENANKTDTGSAYIFVRSGGVWTFQQELAADDAQAGDQFGQSSAVWGDTVIIGASDADAAYAFVRSEGVWTQQYKLMACNAKSGEIFGYSVALYADTALVGAPRANEGEVEAGAAYIFKRTCGVWTQQTKLIASDAAASDWLGYSVALCDGTALIGVRLDDSAAGTDAGSACVLQRPGWSCPSDVTVDGRVNTSDLLRIINDWGPCPPPCSSDNR